MRAFTISATIEKGLNIWARNIVPFTLLSVLAYAPMIVWAYTLTTGTPDLHALRLFAPISGAVISVLNVLLSAMLTYGVVMELRGEHAGLLACIGHGLRRFLPALATAIVVMLAVFGATLLLVVPGIIVGCMLYVAVPAAIVERPGVLGALRRSRQLTRGRKVDVFAIQMVVGLAPGIVNTVARFWILGVNDRRASVTAWIHFVYVETAIMILVSTLGAVFPAVSYFLARQDQEGASVDDLVRVFD
ncbi:MAG TPA: hypothetical protein VHE35_30160 [Kofleriaceae bacterium]|nr:hypothetical protein [Kofleriaceae bacterium]